jgi:GGDEF domain-containing protein
MGVKADSPGSDDLSGRVDRPRRGTAMGFHRTATGHEDLEEQYRGLFDAETGLAGELLLRDRVAVGLARARRFNRYILLVWLEIDVVDEADTETIARAVAGGLRDSIRPDDTVARVDRREFVVLCNDLAHEDAVGAIVRRLHHAIGVVAAHQDGSDPLARIGTTLGQANQDARQVLAHARDTLKPVGRTADVAAAS